MELEDLKRALSNLSANGLQISDLVTDRHAQVRKFMREEMGQICHWFDAWHMAKGTFYSMDYLCLLQIILFKENLLFIQFFLVHQLTQKKC
ncbi:hypothetical protein DPMN_036083 [Dreissena polymorpha]|uniref:Uncharacterized protein n=1 Tax=Dreissena polymorpha TaxID=45954 RepID=A0A9D4MAV8_DREPO|nr:hypothetical protein DPMN_036083 [Dreissena polymorpha]